MLKNLKKFGSVLIIIILLPYVATVFINGVDVKTNKDDQALYIQVRTSSKQGEMTVDEYCIGLLAKELPDEYEDEAVKAQAIVVRTSVYKKIQEKGEQVVFEEEFWNVKDMEANWGTAQYMKRYKQVMEAWYDTDNKVITYEAGFATTPYHQLSNGKTRDGNEVLGSEAYPYLASRECPEDIKAEEQLQTTTIKLMDCEVTETDSADYVVTVRCGDETVSGEDFRKTYGLKSGSFTVQVQDEELRITTKGIGHGLGMSQYTANMMAKDDKNYEEILNYFFAGTEIKEVAEILQISE